MKSDIGIALEISASNSFRQYPVIVKELSKYGNRNGFFNDANIVIERGQVAFVGKNGEGNQP